MRVGANPNQCPKPDDRPTPPSKRKRLRVAVVGCSIGRQHAEAFARLNQHFELVAVCDTDGLRARSVAEQIGEIEWVEKYEDLLNRGDLDLVSICTPPFLHLEQVTMALEAGYHVICEKPLVGSLGDMDRLEAIMDRAGKKIVPVFQMRFGAGLQKLKRLVESGLAGRSFLATIETSWCRGGEYYAAPWRRTWKGSLGGCILSHSVHALDMLCYINGQVDRVQAFAKTLVNPVETEDCATASLEMRDGSLASLSVTLGSVRELSRMRFCFENLVAESNTSPYEYSSDPWKFEGGSVKADRRIEAALQGFAPRPEGYDAQFLDAFGVFEECMPGTTGLNDARISIELATALYHSAQSRMPVKLPLSHDHPAYDGFRPQGGRLFGGLPLEAR